MSTSVLWQIDTQLHDAVQRQLEWDPEIDASRIAVVASEGVVTLTGFVHTYAAKLAAERSVKRVGVSVALRTTFRWCCAARGPTPKSPWTRCTRCGSAPACRTQ